MHSIDADSQHSERANSKRTRVCRCEHVKEHLGEERGEKHALSIDVATAMRRNITANANLLRELAFASCTNGDEREGDVFPISTQCRRPRAL